MARKKFFGEYLIDRRLISEADVLEALTLQREETPTFEKMACKIGAMNMNQVFKVLTLQAETDLSFMDVALRHNFIDEGQAQTVLDCIDSNRPAMGEALIKLGKIDRETMERELDRFQHSVQAYEDIKGLLQEIELFSSLDDVALRSLANITTVRDFSADEYVLREGDPASALYAVSEGTLMITKENPLDNMDALYMGNINEHEVFGESAVLEGGMRTANVLCCNDVTLLEIKRGAFQRFLSNYPSKTQPILTYLIDRLIAKLHNTNQDLALAHNRLYEIQDRKVAEEALETKKASNL
ncbi:MAG: cyclic nucleotide-binding domain-containing protein [Sedimenticola sp.]